MAENVTVQTHSLCPVHCTSVSTQNLEQGDRNKRRDTSQTIVQVLTGTELLWYEKGEGKVIKLNKEGNCNSAKVPSMQNFRSFGPLGDELQPPPS